MMKSPSDETMWTPGEAPLARRGPWLRASMAIDKPAITRIARATATGQGQCAVSRNQAITSAYDIFVNTTGWNSNTPTSLYPASSSSGDSGGNSVSILGGPTFGVYAVKPRKTVTIIGMALLSVT